MALTCKVGSFAVGTSASSDVSVTGIGWQPDLVLFASTPLTSANSSQADANMGTGVGISASEQTSVSSNSEDNQGISDSSTVTNDASVGRICAAGTTADVYSIVLKSLDSDGFTVTTGSTAPNNELVFYMAMGGFDNVDQSNFTITASGGTVSDSGWSFQPDALIVNHGAQSYNQTGPNARLNLHFATGASEEGGAGWGDNNGEATQDANGYISNSTVWTQQLVDGSAQGRPTAELQSFDSNGFTLNVLSTPGSNRNCYAYGLKGGSLKTGFDNTRTSTGNFSVTGLGFQPVGLAILSINSTSFGDQAGISFSLGFTDGTSEYMIAVWCDNGVATTNAGTRFDDDMLQATMDVAAANTILGSISFVSFDSDGFTLSQDDADTALNKIVYFAFGNEAAGGGDIPIFMHHYTKNAG